MPIALCVFACLFLTATLPAIGQTVPPNGYSNVAENEGTAGTPQERAETEPSPPRGEPPKAQLPAEGSMTIERMGEIILRLDENTKSPRRGVWQFHINERPVSIFTDENNNRMRIISPIIKVDDVSEDVMKRMMQANFDSALDARYAVAKSIVWSTFIHPLKSLHDRQFISAIGQTVNLVETFGKSYSSGAMIFGGGDSRGILGRQLIDQLQRKGLDI